MERSVDKLARYIMYLAGAAAVCAVCWYFRSVLVYIILAAVVSQGFNFKNLSYSRDHESEADHMGLIFAAMAGYDPRVAVTFWQRMASVSSGSSSIFSDHPSDAKRVKQIQNWLLEALKYYQGK